jgi:hypothetical protein
MAITSMISLYPQKKMIGLAGMLLAEPFLLKLLYARLLRDVSTAVTYRVTPWSMRSTPALAQVQQRSCFLHIARTLCWH